MKWLLAAVAALVALAPACGAGGGGTASGGSTVTIADFQDGAAFYDSPFPSDHRVGADGKISLAGFPNPDGITLVDDVLALAVHDSDGFGVSSGAFFRWSGALDPASLPAAPGDTLTVSSPVFLIDVDSRSPERGRRFPLYVGFQDDAGPLGTTNLLVMVPVQGIPLRPGTRYAAGITTAITDTSGAHLGIAPEVAALARGKQPDGMNDAAFAHYRDGIAALADLGVAPRSLAAVAVFTTGNPMRRMQSLSDTEETIALPTPVTDWQLTDLFDDFCVLESRIDMPIFQQGKPPFFTQGGDIAFDASGAPIQTGTEPSRLVVTLPRRAEPASGFPGVVFIRTGGGGDRPLVDRGRQPGTGQPAIEPGEGPARYIARAGLAAISFDGPHGGLRDVTGINEDLTVYNFFNPKALVDNVRETAAETALVGRLFATLSWPASVCPGLDASARPNGRAAIDGSRMAVQGHSIGATVAPLALATSARFRVSVVDGEGGSYLENVLYKKSPLDIDPIATAILRYGKYGATLTRTDPFLSVLQWAAEAADPPTFGRSIIHEPVTGHSRHVLMFQGNVDTYITPSIANASTGSFGLDLAGPNQEDTINDILVLSGGTRIALPASGNLTGSEGQPVTGVVVQYAQDGVEDGHEIMFQLDAPKRQYQCFYSTFARDLTPVVPDEEPGAPCP